MKYIASVVLLATFCSCQNHDASVSSSEALNSTGTRFEAEQANSAITSQKEFIEWNKVKLNGRLPMETKTTDLFQLVGQPDSIIAPDMRNVCATFYNKPLKFAYHNNSQFEIYGEKAVVGAIDFRNESRLFLKTDKFTFDHNTTLTDLENHFPLSSKEKYEVVVSDLGSTIAVSISDAKEYSESSWLFFFIDGKLVRIDYNIPC